jgi:hypothetical protein
MVDLLIALESFNKLFRHIGIHPDEIDVVEMVFLIVKLVIEVFVDQIMYDRVLSFE